MGKIAAILVHTLFITMFLSVGSPSRAQQVPPPPPQDVPKELTFTLSGTFTVGEIFDQLHRQTNIYVNRNHAIIDFTRKLTVHFRSTSIREVMDKVLGDLPIDWMITGLDIVLFPSANPVRLKEETITVTGLVMDKDGVVLPGVTIMVKGEQKGGVTNGEGRFRIEKVLPKSTLVINSIGFLSRQYRLDGERKVTFILEPAVSQIEPVEITANTGYQVLKKKETPGAVVVIDSALINRPVTPNILDRLEGVTGGLLAFRSQGAIRYISKMPDGVDYGFYIRGFSSVSPNRVNPNPLIVLDNFPYEGDPKNINPNDIETITVLKDAASSSIWGARSGNGVIVMTTKKGRYNEKMRIDVNSSLTVGLKPNLFYDPNFLEASDYIDVERKLFDLGYFENDINDRFSYPPISPVVDLLNKRKKGSISEEYLNEQLKELAQNDVRRDLSKYSYRNSVNQQYAVSIRGGTKDLGYYLSLGHDRNQSETVRNGRTRTTLISSSTFSPLKNMEINGFINYALQNTDEGNEMVFRGIQSRAGKFTDLYPYARFTDNNGNPVPIAKDLSANYTDSLNRLGYLDWKFRPLDEIGSKVNSTSFQNLILRLAIKYKFFKNWTVEVNYQNQRQIIYSKMFWSKDSYYARDLVNTFTTYNPVTGKLTNNLPVGGIMNIGDYDWKANNLRTTVSYERKIKDHSARMLLGGEARDLTADGIEKASVGYENINGVPVTNINPNILYPTIPFGESRLSEKIGLNGAPVGLVNRYISYFSILDYNYMGKYEMSLSARRDGANLFGIATNRTFSPFWSIGAGWSIYKEEFFKVPWVNTLKLRTSLGENGNVYFGSAYLTIFRDIDPLTGLPSNSISNAPNKDLKWERIRMSNVGMDFAILNYRISGTVDYFFKKSLDLVQRTNVAPQTGYLNAMTNSAESQTRGYELTLNSSFKFNKIKWGSRLVLNHLKDRLNKYDPKPSRQTIILTNPYFDQLRVPGYSLKGIFSYKWSGLDPKTGDPQGYLNGAISKDYSAILNTFHPDSLVYHGSAVPTYFGSIRNDLVYKRLTLSATIGFKLGYFFRKNGVSTNYAELLTYRMHKDYNLRWQSPEDELKTSVPSIVYPSNDFRNQFYQKSEIMVLRGDHVRMQDVRVSYALIDKPREKKSVKFCEFYVYMTNLGILWRANREGIDPDVSHATIFDAYPIPFSISGGVMLKL
ncbi:SusC/RagA family TonB-linked outer membrane protein [Chitinophaga sp. NPDC101104]|uniref:SusC/RagA family TonB-linked outer membrane protein n=1 Tax=Chitinophaga sp. NPDC101104 TaxID=3390561 RepID=UPI003CFC93F8